MSALWPLLCVASAVISPVVQCALRWHCRQRQTLMGLLVVVPAARKRPRRSLLFLEWRHADHIYF